jgi:hypothetical protein
VGSASKFVMPDWSRNDLTNGDILHPAMEVQTEVEAAAYLAGYIDFKVRRFGKSRDEAERIVKADIGYWTGYFDEKTQERVLRLFEYSHPIFGTARPDAETALRAGRGAARG